MAMSSSEQSDQAFETDKGDTSTESVTATKSSTSLSSVLSVTAITSKKQKNAAKKKSLFERRKEKKRQKKIEKNKIDKEDYYAKHTEFRTWLWEEKGVRFEDISASKAKEHFKKFIKKWNSKKLGKQYYRGIDSCWFDGSPATQSLWAMPGNVAMTPGSLREEQLDQRYSRVQDDTILSTFGKKTGKRALKELQRMRIEYEKKEGPEKENQGDLSQSTVFSAATNTEENQIKKTSSSSLPEKWKKTIPPKLPKRCSSLTNMHTLQLTAVFQDDLDEGCKALEETHSNTLRNNKRSSSTELSSESDGITPNKMQKKSYSTSTPLDSHDQAMFSVLRAQSTIRKPPSSTRRPMSMDNSVFCTDSELQIRPRTPSSSSVSGQRKSAVLSLLSIPTTPSKW